MAESTAPISKGEAHARFDNIDKGLERIERHLARLNGTTGEHGEAIAVLKARVDDLRGQDAEAKRTGAKWGGAAGAIVGALLAFAQFLRGGQ